MVSLILRIGTDNYRTAPAGGEYGAFNRRTARPRSRLRMRAGVARTGACGRSTGAAERALIRLRAGDFHFEKGACGDVEFQTATAAVDNSAGGDGDAAFLFDDSDRFTGRAAGGPNVFDDEHAISRKNLEAAAEGHLPRAIALDKKGTHTKGPSDFVADDHSTERRRNNTADGKIAKVIGERGSQLFGKGRVGQHQGALDISSAMAPAG